MVLIGLGWRKAPSSLLSTNRSSHAPQATQFVTGIHADGMSGVNRMLLIITPHGPPTSPSGKPDRLENRSGADECLSDSEVHVPHLTFLQIDSSCKPRCS